MKTMFYSIGVWILFAIAFVVLAYLFEQYSFVMKRLLMILVGSIIFLMWATSWKDSKDQYGLFLATPVAFFGLIIAISGSVMLYNYWF